MEVEETEEIEEFAEEIEEDAEEVEEEGSLRDSIEAAYDEAIDEPEEEQEAAETDFPEEGSETPEQPEEVAGAIEFPSYWDAETKEQMAKMPTEFQKWATQFSKSQQDSFHRTKRQLSEEVQRVQRNFGDLVETIKPYEESIRAAGETPHQRIGQLLELDRSLFEGSKETARQTILQLCQDAEVTPQELFGGYGGQYQNGAAYSDPKVQELQAEVQQLRQQAQQQSEYVKQQQQREQQAQIEQINGTIQAFASETDENGSPLRPFFEDVQEQLVPLVAGIKNANPEMPHVEVLAQAYDIAVSRNPDVQAKLQAKAQKDEQLRKAREAKAKA